MKSCLAISLLLCVACAANPVLGNAPATPALGQGNTSTAVPSTLTIPPPSATAEPATPTIEPPQRDFTEDFDGTLPYWSFLQVDNGRPADLPTVDGGFLRFDLPQPNQWVYALYGAQEYPDVRVDALVTTSAGQGGAAGIVCRYSEKNGWYEFNIYADQTYVLLFGQWLKAGAVARYTPIVRSASEKIKTGENEIGLECKGDILTPFINGTQMMRREEKLFGLTSGQIGISASSFEAVPLQISYDWVKISEP
jgi:hypothetical protein